MKDLDFDELDRAVNSILSDTEKAPVVSSVEVQPNPVPQPTLDLPAEPYDAPQVESTPLPITVPAVSSRPMPTLPATRRSGRFMDVVHPSSDMKSANMKVIPTANEVKFDPFSPRAADMKPLDSTLDSPLSPLTPQASEAIAPPSDITWPDPIAIPQPLTSPFLPDAKVEKRPLGGSFLDASARELPNATVEPTVSGPIHSPASIQKSDLFSSEEKKTEDDKQLVPDIEKSIPQLPVELNNDLATIEAEYSTLDNNGIPTRGSDLEDSGEVTSPNTLIADSTATTLIPGSIPQQYKEQSNTGDTSHAPIYDIQDVHQPLSHPASKKSGWLWVIWITLILALGAGVGAAAFYMGLF